MKQFIRENFLFLLVFVVAIFLRLYRFSELAVFRADGAIDLLTVVNITRGKFTLLGPQVSVAGFFNGPIVYYLMTPFVLFFGSSPLVGILFQTVFMLFSIIILYLFGSILFNKRIALIASFLACISPLHITYGRQIFNAYPAVLFSTLILLMFAMFIKKKLTNLQTYIIIFFAGIFSGMIVQMHYLSAFFIILGFLFPIFIDTRFKKISYYTLFTFGIFIGIFPYLLFEVRHDFLNSRKAFDYIFLTSSSSDPKNILYGFEALPRLLGNLVFGNNYLVGMIISLTWLLLFIKQYIVKKIHFNSQNKLVITTLILTFIVIFSYGRLIQTHYIISIHLLILLLLAVFISRITTSKKCLLVTILFVIVLLNALSWHLHAPYHPLQDSLRVSDFQKAAQSIYKSTGTKSYNITMDAQTDNRAWPIRYFLMLTNQPPQDIYTYGKTDYLFVLARKNKPLNQLTMWEFTSFGSYTIKNKTTINESYVLYQLAK